MSFIAPDEFNLLMDLPEVGPYATTEYHAVPEDDLRRLVDAGCTTAITYALWTIIEPQRGAMVWRYLDLAVERYRRVGMKCIIFGPADVPLWCPDSWYCKDASGRLMKDIDRNAPTTLWGCLSPWNHEAQQYQLDFISALVNRYSAADVIVAGSHSRDGESFLPPGAVALYDDAALADYARYTGTSRRAPNAQDEDTQSWLRQSCLVTLMRQQRVYAAKAGETWMQLHPHYARYPASGASIMHEAIPMLREMGPVSWLLYTHFPHLGNRWYAGKAEQLICAGAQVWAGSEWPEGLMPHTPLAIEQGLRGLVTAPCHPFLNRRTVEPWAIEAFRQSRRMWNGRR